jgi:hypothetical protein
MLVAQAMGFDSDERADCQTGRSLIGLTAYALQSSKSALLKPAS